MRSLVYRLVYGLLASLPALSTLGVYIWETSNLDSEFRYILTIVVFVAALVCYLFAGLGLLAFVLTNRSKKRPTKMLQVFAILVVLAILIIASYVYKTSFDGTRS